MTSPSASVQPASMVDASKIVYNIIANIKERTAMLIVFAHIYTSNSLFQKCDQNSYIVPYLIVISIMCLLWEMLHALVAMKSDKGNTLDKVLFVTFTTLTRYINFVAIGLFSTNGNPLTCLLSSYPDNIINYSIIALIILSYVFNQIENYYWHDLIDIEDKLESDITFGYQSPNERTPLRGNPVSGVV